MIYAANLFREDTLSRWCATEVDSEGVMVPVSVFIVSKSRIIFFFQILYLHRVNGDGVRVLATRSS